MTQLRRSPLLLGLLAAYVTYCLAVPVLFAIEHYLPKPMDWPLFLYIVWPYPLVLALQTWARPQSIQSNLLVYGLGLVLVFAWGRWLQSRFGPSRPVGWILLALVPWLWAPPVIAL